MEKEGLEGSEDVCKNKVKLCVCVHMHIYAHT